MSTETINETETPASEPVLLSPNPATYTLSTMPDGAILSDDLVIDAESGEVLGAIVPENYDTLKPMDAGLAEWVLSKLQNREAALSSIGVKIAKIKAGQDHLLEAVLSELYTTPEWLSLRAQASRAQQIADKASRERGWFMDRFRADLEDFAKRILAGSKKRSWYSVFGSLSLTKFAEGVEIEDMARAVDLAEAINMIHADLPNAVTIKKEVTKSALKWWVLSAYSIPDDADPFDEDAARNRQVLNAILSRPGSVRLTPAGEKLKIDTAVS
jgi:hypothetical protein